MTEKQKNAFSHLDREGRAQMVDISPKPRVKRSAAAAGRIQLQPQTVQAIRDRLVQKGDVLAVARVAGITAAKKASELIPLCHNIAIDQVSLEFSLQADGIDIRSRAVRTDKTGIEMEALTAVSVAALTIYDMCKAVDDTMRIDEIRLLQKTKEAV